MESCIIFIPDYIKKYDFCYLYGFIDYCCDSNCSIFYVIELSRTFQSSSASCDLLGVFNDTRTQRMPLPKDWVVINKKSCYIELDWLIVDHKQFNLAKSLFIFYDLDSFFNAGLMLNDNCNYEKDYYKKLAFYVKAHSINATRKTYNYSFPNGFMFVLTSILYLLDQICMVLKYSTFAIHFKDCLKSLLDVLKSYERDEPFSLQSGNYLCATIIDMIIGALVLRSLSSVDDIFTFFSMRAENVINSITELVKWLMDSPAGLKLNHPLNQIIGGFFLYNINLWWTFLGVVEPVLKYGFYIFLNLGFLGFSYQIAILADLFILATFHVYCIYVYAARLYRLQVQGLWSLSKLVIGKKRNPIPGRIDSCPYTTEQLFVGTISFTVLLFLMPTVLVYYIVFVIMRLGVVGLCGVMTRTRYYIQIFPAYITVIWLFKPSLTAMTVKLYAQNQHEKNGIICWKAEAIPVSWFETVKRCIPQSVLPPPSVKWTEIFHNVTTGRLIYPL